MIWLLASLVDILCTFNEAFWMWKYIDLLYERRKRKGILAQERWMLPGIQMAGFVAIVIAMNHFIQLVSPFAIHIILIYGVVTACLFWKCNVWNAVAVMGGYLFMNGAVRTTEVSLTGVLGGDIFIRQTTAQKGWIRIIYLCICGAIWYGLNRLVYELLRKKKINTASLKYLAYLSMIGLAGFTYIFLQMLSNFDIQVNILWYAFLFLMALGMIGIYFFLENRQMKERLILLDNQNRILENNYDKTCAFYQEKAMLQHDIHHHLTAVLHLMNERKEEEARKYIVSLIHPVTSGAMQIRTGIDVVDVILSEMEQKAAEKGIPVVMHIQMLPQEFPVEKRDFCALFANLLENAVEAAEKEITVIIKIVNSMLLIQVQNDYKVEPVWKNGRPQSRKSDPVHHGWGTRSVEYVVKKYCGSMEYKNQDGVFCVDIILNI